MLEQRDNENLRLNARLNDTAEMAQELEAEWTGEASAKFQLQRQVNRPLVHVGGGTERVLGTVVGERVRDRRTEVTDGADQRRGLLR